MAKKQSDEYGRAPKYKGTTGPVDLMRAIRDDIGLTMQDQLLANATALENEAKALDARQKKGK